MRTEQFDYNLPLELIAQEPIEPRDQSRLLLCDRENGRLEDHIFRDLLDYLKPGDLLIANNTRVIPARLFGKKVTGGKVELLLLEELAPDRWRAMVGGRKMVAGTPFRLNQHNGEPSDVTAEITAVLDGPQREIQFNLPLTDYLADLGHTPLPPYIHPKLDDPERYQTVYSQHKGSAAAPTAGLHFTPELLLALREKGISFETVTLHVGLDTFKPVTAAEIKDHPIHSEWAVLTAATAKRINETRLAGGRIVAVGTTTVRVLESAALRAAGHHSSLRQISRRDAAGEQDPSCPWQVAAAFSGSTDLFIYPGYRFRLVDAMITNFHLPKSSLLMLVAAFSSKEMMDAAYKHAIANAYRFFSFGDAMFIY